MVFCINCVYDPIGRKSSNIWISGGPAPFPSGQICSLCSGVGTRAEQVTKTITLLCHYDPKKFVTKLPTNVEVGAGAVETKGYLTDLQSVLQSREMIIQPDLSPHIKWRYKLASEPTNPSNIIQSRYFFCIWNRSGG